MEKQKHPIDDLFREALDGLRVEPTAREREAFLNEAAQELRKGGSRRRWFLIGLLALITAGTGAGLFYLIPAATLKQPTGKTTPSVISAQTIPEPDSTLVNSSSAPTNDPAKEETIQTQTNDSGSQMKTIETNRIASAGTTPPVPVSETFMNESHPPPSDVPRPEVNKDSAFISNYSDSVELAISNPSAAVQPAETVPSDTTQNKKMKKTAPSGKKGTSLLVGVNYIPEWMFNTLEGDKYVNNFGLEGTFRFERYSVRTGVGLSITQGTNELAIGYNDYLGTYESLDSMSFAWDNQHYNLLPTYYMSDQDVWDSLVKIEENKVIKRYTYLQIPLILGYDFLVKGRFAMGVRTGPVLSLLLASKQLSANFDPGKDQIVAINQVTPDRVQTNWQVMAGINFSFLLSKRWTIELEPEGRYYFNSVYEKSDITKKPWSVGIRAAINFDLKK